MSVHGEVELPRRPVRVSPTWIAGGVWLEPGHAAPQAGRRESAGSGMSDPQSAKPGVTAREPGQFQTTASVRRLTRRLTALIGKAIQFLHAGGSKPSRDIHA